MDNTTYRISEILKRLPVLLEVLSKSTPYELEDLTPSVVSKIMGVTSKAKCGGVYLFSERESSVPVYVGRSKNLAQRLGTQHRGLECNQAKLTAELKIKYEMRNMQDARQYLYDNYVVRILPEQDIIIRAILEIYIATVYDTEHNSFLEY